jgi:hypothetical protein
MSLAGPPQEAKAPAGGSDDTTCGAWGLTCLSLAGPPQEAKAPAGGSDDTTCGAWGLTCPP